ncbi:hypothetical protein AJ79_04044 [Helicocarpus griseus UAMH5409]|uniref:Maintenance of telomere capping protein 6 n=1 Tax=Helicocarpus griseus UAMH5409 TaxID=1447875 RepID=A0A2B7XUZ2_9EURO|nr:hypothetical protein AJ79_04044 [Helicocarpus griseus UAMH5409]
MPMIANYTPAYDAITVAPWNVVQLSQRDTSRQIPINHIPHPGITLTSACFSHKVYEERALVRCLSNIISVGFRRLHADIYWSAEQRRWIFCPATVRSKDGGVESIHEGSTDGPSDSSSQLTVPDYPADETGAINDEVSTPAGVLLDAGPYSCTQTLDISLFLSLLEDWLYLTDTTLDVEMLYIILDLHSAASADLPGEPSNAPAPEQLPSGPELLGPLFNTSFRPFLYTPKELEQERSNLNRSWYSVPPSWYPISEYFTTNKDSKGYHTTPDGWPPEIYLELYHSQKRVLVGWGTVDPQMETYNFSGDSDLIFPRGSLSKSKEIVVSDNGNNGSTLESGCLFDPKSTDLSNIDASWAEATITQRRPSEPLHLLSSELMACGISPIINSTLSNVTADVDFLPYQNVSYASQWAWAKDEPSEGDTPEDIFLSDLRCVRVDTSINGRWFPAKCSDEFYGVCRIGNEPFHWAITPERVSFDEVSQNCPVNTTFSRPRTSLESTYLYRYLLSQPQDIIDPSSEDVDKRSVWIDLNSVDIPTCWIAGGMKAQCPYEPNENAVQKRTVLVPTIAAIIVLVVGVLTIFVKCNTNRRNSRRTRVIKGWEYEGVPS